MAPDGRIFRFDATRITDASMRPGHMAPDGYTLTVPDHQPYEGLQ
ncbi:MAG: hypothetical protein RLY78_4273 [Pseudomonadota bacterium]